MLKLLYLFTSVCAYVQSEEYYYDRIAVNVYGHGHSFIFVDGVSEYNGKLASYVDGNFHSLSSETTDKLKKQALDDASLGEEAQYWYGEGLAAFLNSQSMQVGPRITQLYTVIHTDNGASIKWESSDIRLKQEGEYLLITGPTENYKLSSPNELLGSTYQSSQYIQSPKVGRRYNQHSADPVRQEDDASDIVSTIVFSPRN